MKRIRKGKFWTAEELDLAAADYARLKSLKKTAALWGINFVSLSSALHRHARLAPRSNVLEDSTVTAIVATYRLTGSCQETARRWGRTRQSIWEILSSRGLTNPNDIHLNRRKDGVVYKGERFTPDKDGYLRSTRYKTRLTGGHRLLHRVVWEDHNGPVPAGMIVAFKDGNRQNCAIGNLRIVSKSYFRKEPGRWIGNGWTKYNLRKAELLEAWQRALATGDKEQIAATRLAYDSLPQPKRCPREKRSALMKAKWASYTPQQREERIRKSYEGRHGERLVG